jgi:translation initiation factor 5A
MADDEQYDDAGEAQEGCQPLQASAFRKGTNIILKDKPCKVVEMSTSKTGKHGHAKINFTGIDIFTGKKYKALQASTHNMWTFESSKSEWSVMSLDGENLQLINEEGETREDIGLPADEELAKQIKEAVEAGEKEVFVTVLTALKQDQVVAFNLKDHAE